MHRLLLFFIASISALLTGCNNESNPENEAEQSPLVGQWVTTSCTQVEERKTATTQLWALGNYEFTSYGRIYSTPKLYLDSDCTLPHIAAESPANVPPIVSYQDLGATILQEGIDGRAFVFEMIFDGESYPTDAFFTIDGDSLCFSNVLTFEALRFGLELYGSMDIDFENCLIRS